MGYTLVAKCPQCFSFRPVDRTDKILKFAVKATSFLPGGTTIGVAQCMIADITLATPCEYALTIEDVHLHLVSCFVRSSIGVLQGKGSL